MSYRVLLKNNEEEELAVVLSSISQGDTRSIASTATVRELYDQICIEFNKGAEDQELCFPIAS